MRTHQLKSWPKFFEPLQQGRRTHELRRNDRDFRVGDLLELHEYLHETRTFPGRSCTMEVTSITSASEPCAVSATALNPDYCILSVRLVAR